MPTPSLPLLLVVGLAGGALAGVGLERAGVVSPIAEDDEAPAEVAIGGDRVPVLDCPDGVVVAGLAAGDRVLATGRSDDGAWIEIRSPVDLEARAWVSAPALRGDEDLSELSERECDRPPGATTTTSSTTTSTSTTSTSSTTSTTAPPQTTTTVRGTDRPPVLDDATSSESSIATGTPPSPTVCFVPGGPVTTAISVFAGDDRPGLVVSMSYDTIAGGQTISSGSLGVSANGTTYTGVLGPLPQSAAAAGAATIARVTILATDSSGQRAGPITIDVSVIRCQQ